MILIVMWIFVPTEKFNSDVECFSNVELCSDVEIRSDVDFQ